MDSRTPWYVRNPIDPLRIFAGIINGHVPPENLPSGWNLTGNRLGNWPEASYTYGKPNVPNPEDLDEGPANSDWSEEEEEEDEFGEDSDSDSDSDMEMEMADTGDDQQQLAYHNIPIRFKRRRLSRQPYRLLIDPITRKCCDNLCGFNDNVVVDMNRAVWDPDLGYTSSSSSSSSSCSSANSANSVLCNETGVKATCRYIPPSHYTGLLQLSQISPLITREFASYLFFNSVFEFPEGPSLFPHFIRDRPAVLPHMRGIILHVECSADFLDTVDSELEWMLKFITNHEEINLHFFTVVLNTGLIHIAESQTDEERELYKILVMKKLESWAPLFRQLRTEDFLLDMRPLPNPGPIGFEGRWGSVMAFEDLKVIAGEIIGMWLPDCLRKEKKDATTDHI
ncbi:hypothetical protein B0T20DRAFT_360994 [Sordaria brevicollis]|uniref:Uncharacterized protein n=1 Tax=Sordaria brevicollis TaxID=83679 RepID=A0AAE0P361_SORBR|nr:hypothetical protein B0T20DRAFT_360994 [Sordaria brevicollis]